MRAQEWIPSTPLHVRMYHFLAGKLLFCHLPMVNEDGQNRVMGQQYERVSPRGYLPRLL